MSEFFKFEEEGIDFPFYKNNPKLSALDWLIMIIGVLVFISIIIFPIFSSSTDASLAFGFIMIALTLYVSKGKISMFFRMPMRKDIKLIALCLIGYYIYAIGLNIILEQLGNPGTTNAVVGANMDLIFWISMLIQLMGEELIKVIAFLMIMTLIYKISKKRKLSMTIGVIASLLLFGMLHYSAYDGNMIQIIFVIGLGSLFYFFAYLKTKNVMISYIIHVLIDGLIFLMVMMATALGSNPSEFANLILALI